MCWELEWRHKVLVLTEGANSCAGNVGFEGRQETSLMFLSKLELKSSHRGCLSEFEQNNYVWGVLQNPRRLKVCGFFRIEGSKCLGFWVCSHKY